jgi:hypothetical protein
LLKTKSGEKKVNNMSMPNSVEEIDNGMLHEGISQLDVMERFFYEMKTEMRHAYSGKEYMLDHCGEGAEYCRMCRQPECGKRMK